MKKYFAVSTVVMFLILTHFAFAQSPLNRIDRALLAYEQALEHSNNGVVESAIINIMKLKLIYPNQDYSRLTKKLNKLCFKDRTKTVRYKAYIAANYLQHPERFTWLKSECANNLNDFFSRYEACLERQLKRTGDNLVAVTTH